MNTTIVAGTGPIAGGIAAHVEGVWVLMAGLWRPGRRRVGPRQTDDAGDRWWWLCMVEEDDVSVLCDVPVDEALWEPWLNTLH